MIALLFVCLLLLAIWLAIRLGGVRRRDQPSGSTRRDRHTDKGTIIGQPGDGGVLGSAAGDSDGFQGSGGDFGGGGASGSWGDAGGDGGGGGGGD